MELSRRKFNAILAASCFPQFVRMLPQAQQPGPVCIYESNEPYDYLPDGWLLLGAGANPRHSYTEMTFNVAFIHRVYLDRINGVLVATIWLKGSPTPFEPYRCTVGDLPRLVAELADYHRKVAAGIT